MSAPTGPVAPVEPVDPLEIADWLTGRLADLLEIPVEDVDVTVPLDLLGVSSMEEVEITASLETQYGLTLPVTEMRRHPTVESLCGYIAGLMAAV